MQPSEPCQFLEWDTAFFGWRIGRVTGTRLTGQRMVEIREWCRRRRIDCLYFLADLSDPETISIAEENRFHLVAVRVTMLHDLPAVAEDSLPPTDAANVREWRPGDLSLLCEIARESHTDSRYFFDRNFPDSACRAFYEEWIRRSCAGYADRVLVAEDSGVPVGYITCHRRPRSFSSPESGQIGLIGVHRDARGRGVGRGLIRRALRWFRQEGIERVSVVTQARNIAAQCLYQSVGFRTYSVQTWYHKWMEENRGAVRP
ncbi:MAG TPA: GNAT family N-acetyltransferase [Kiritimatiellae bacterium]|nr:GNAT family N-acetyltransferase [Kiritimatiellia bacterium]